MQEKGFTLIETLIVVGITIMLSVVVLGYNRSTDADLALFRDQAIVIGSVNRAKALAIEKFNSPGACGFGVHFSEYSRSFFIFEDQNMNPGSDCRNNGAYLGTGMYEAGEEINPTFMLDRRFRFWLYVEDAAGFGSQIERGEFDILFIPPDPTTTSTDLLPASVYVGRGSLPSGGSGRNPPPNPDPIPSDGVRVILSPAGQITGR